MDWGGTHSDESSIIVLLLIHCDDDDLIIMNVRQYNYIVFFNVTVVEFIMVLFLSSDPYSIIFDDITIFLHPVLVYQFIYHNFICCDSNNNNNNNNNNNSMV